MPLARMHGRTGELSSFLVCVDSYENHLFDGRLIYGKPQQERPFLNLMQLLLEMEKYMDDTDKPPSAMEKRVFAKVDDLSDLIPEQDYKVINEVEGKIATFNIHILFRQNASWQGSISWIEGNSEMTFRSALELITLMASALESN